MCSVWKVVVLRTICLNFECDCLVATKCCNFWTGRRIHTALFCTTSSTHCWSVCLCCTSIGGFWCGAWLSSKFKTAVKFPKTSDQVHTFPQAVYRRNTYNDPFKQLGILQWHPLILRPVNNGKGIPTYLSIGYLDIEWVCYECSECCLQVFPKLILGSHRLSCSDSVQLCIWYLGLMMMFGPSVVTFGYFFLIAMFWIHEPFSQQLYL